MSLFDVTIVLPIPFNSGSDQLVLPQAYTFALKAIVLGTSSAMLPVFLHPTRFCCVVFTIRFVYKENRFILLKVTLLSHTLNTCNYTKHKKVDIEDRQ